MAIPFLSKIIVVHELQKITPIMFVLANANSLLANKVNFLHYNV